MPTFVLSLLKSKTAWIAIAVTLALGYHYLIVNSLEKDNLKKEVTIVKLEKKLGTSLSNTKKCITISKENIDIITEYEEDFKEIEIHYLTIIDQKNIVISGLRDDIDTLNKPVTYPEEYNYKNCTIKIKQIKDINESDNKDKIFKSLLNIGR